jgi:hypothetical protein
MERLQDKITREQYAALNGLITHLTFVEADGAQTYTMTASEQAIIVASGHADNTLTLTLPPVQEAAGKFYFIIATNGATATTTVEDDGGDAGYADLTMDADADHVLIYSTGERWLTVVNGIA